MTEMTEWKQEAWDAIVRKVSRTSKEIGNRFPHASVNGQYVLEAPHWWTAGFWPGLLWLVYRDTSDESLKNIAESCESQLDQVLAEFDRLDHDLGFMWQLTSVARYKLTGDTASRRRALLAASVLAGRFNVQGRYIRAWNPWRPGETNAGWAIIDCMMNLPLLYWASRETGDPRFRHLAAQHADTVLQHFIDPDGSVRHIVIFDPESGEKIGVNGGQGYSEHSAWSRGASWAIYGMALSYRYTGDIRFLHAAQQTANYFIANLPADKLPVWDFRLPTGVPRHLDTSAGACAACGLLLLSELVSEEQSALYREAGEGILHSLYTICGAWDDENEQGLILHGTSHFPEGRNIDVPLIYGDYFFAEGISRLQGHGELFW
ncbi:glycoside hydrolase family 88 protein [Paenibacillus sp. CAU 1782]